MQDFDLALLFTNSVIDANRGVQHHSYAGAAAAWSTKAGELTQQLHMVEQSDAKSVSRRKIVSADVVEHHSKIF